MELRRAQVRGGDVEAGVEPVKVGEVEVAAAAEEAEGGGGGDAWQLAQAGASAAAAAGGGGVRGRDSGALARVRASSPPARARATRHKRRGSRGEGESRVPRVLLRRPSTKGRSGNQGVGARPRAPPAASRRAKEGGRPRGPG